MPKIERFELSAASLRLLDRLAALVPRRSYLRLCPRQNLYHARSTARSTQSLIVGEDQSCIAEAAAIVRSSARAHAGRPDRPFSRGGRLHPIERAVTFKDRQGEIVPCHGSGTEQRPQIQRLLLM